MAAGEIELDFGAFPGKSDAEVTVPGQTGIVSGSLIEAWLHPKDTADHSADEHMLETIKIFADPSTIVAGTSFKIKGFNTSQLHEPLVPFKGSTFTGAVTSAQVNPALNQMPTRGGIGTRIWGKWNVAWAGDHTN